jgi:hypothetical protein
MRKRDHRFKKVQEYRDRFIQLPSETLMARLADYRLIK